MWRPDKDWDKQAWNFTKGSPEARAYYEAGADALLKSLKSIGIEVEPVAYLLSDEASRRDIIVPKSKGKLVFIPDDDTD